MKPHIFISYCKLDVNKIKPYVNSLSQYEIDLWVDYRELVAGDVWEQKILKTVRECDAFVVFLSPNFNRFGFRQKEIRAAIQALESRPIGQNFLIPIMIEECNIPEWCENYHVQKVDDSQDGLVHILKATEAICGYRVLLSDIGTKRLNLLLDMLKSPFPTDQIGGLTSISETGNTSLPVIEHVGKLAIHDDLSVKNAAVHCLERIGVEAIPFVAASLMHKSTTESISGDADLRKRIAYILHTLDPNGASLISLKALMSTFGDESGSSPFDPGLGGYVASLFRNYHNAIPLLIEVISNEELALKIREDAAWAFILLNPVPEDDFESIVKTNQECANLIFSAFHSYCFITGSPDKTSEEGKRFKPVLEKLASDESSVQLKKLASKAIYDIEHMLGFDAKAYCEYY